MYKRLIEGAEEHPNLILLSTAGFGTQNKEKNIKKLISQLQGNDAVEEAHPDSVNESADNNNDAATSQNNNEEETGQAKWTNQ